MKLTAPPFLESLNAQVAIRVMGLSRVEWGERTPCPYCGNVGRYCGSRSYCCDCESWYSSGYKDYDCDFNVAMEAVEKLTATTTNEVMKTLGFAVFTIHRYPDGRWRASFNGKDASAVSTSLPEAICKAALAAAAHNELSLEIAI